MLRMGVNFLAACPMTPAEGACWAQTSLVPDVARTVPFALGESCAPAKPTSSPHARAHTRLTAQSFGAMAAARLAW